MAGSGGSSCPICAQGTYSSDIGEAIICAACPAGRTTANTGASSADECLNPTANFVLGALLLPLCLAVVFYLTWGRIHWVAEVRRLTFAVKIAELLNRVYATLQLETKSKKEETRADDAERVKDDHEHMMIFLRTWTFFFVAGTYLIFNMLIYFILNVNRIFFSSMIIAKSYQRSNADLNYRFVFVFRVCTIYFLPVVISTDFVMYIYIQYICRLYQVMGGTNRPEQCFLCVFIPETGFRSYRLSVGGAVHIRPRLLGDQPNLQRSVSTCGVGP